MKQKLKVDIEDKYNEAVIRLRKLNISEYIINQFKINKIIYNSYKNAYSSSASDKLKTIIKDFELNYNCLVYYSISNNTMYGYTSSLLYVSDFKAEWDFDRKWLDENRTLAYIHNYENQDLSTFQEIGFNKYYGLLQRLY